MKAKDLRDRTTEDLSELERSLADERFQNQFKNFTNRLDDTSLIRKTRRDLARVKSILAERARGGGGSATDGQAITPAEPGPKGVSTRAATPKAAAAAPSARAPSATAADEPRAGSSRASPKAAKASRADAPAAKAKAAKAEPKQGAKTKPKSTERTESK
jgi:large subunit ribosomal protein L29